MYPGDPGPPGGDCAGVISAVGSGVTARLGLRPGSAVFGLAPGCLGPTVVAPAEMLAPLPPALTYEAAATTPTVYVTVLTAFGLAGTDDAAAAASSDLDNAAERPHGEGRGLLCPGSRVLVHAGTGGVGLAAIQVGGCVCHGMLSSQKHVSVGVCAPTTTRKCFAPLAGGPRSGR